MVKYLVDDDEDDDNKGEDGESEGEESPDEDFIPNPASEDEDSGDDEAFDDDVAEIAPSTTASAGPGKKRRAATTAANAKLAAARKRAKGGIQLEDEEEPLANGTPPELEDDESRKQDGKPAATSKAPTAVDDIWASMNADSSIKKSTAAATETDATKNNAMDDMWAELNAGPGMPPNPSTGSGKAASSGLDIKALLAKTGSKPGGGNSSAAAGVRMVEIKQKMDFCGEEVVITKKVAEGSQEDLAYRQSLGKKEDKDGSTASQPTKNALVSSALAASAQLRKTMLNNPAANPAAPKQQSDPLRTDSSLEFKPALPPPKLPGVVANKPTGLQGLLASIDGKKKMSTMEKSRHDWGNFKEKQDDQTRDEMERFAKDGYLAKQAFLARTDERQAEVARTNRRKGMGLKD